MASTDPLSAFRYTSQLNTYLAAHPEGIPMLNELYGSSCQFTVHTGDPKVDIVLHMHHRSVPFNRDVMFQLLDTMSACQLSQSLTTNSKEDLVVADYLIKEFKEERLLLFDLESMIRNNATMSELLNENANDCPEIEAINHIFESILTEDNIVDVLSAADGLSESFRSKALVRYGSDEMISWATAQDVWYAFDVSDERFRHILTLVRKDKVRALFSEIMYHYVDSSGNGPKCRAIITTILKTFNLDIEELLGSQTSIFRRHCEPILKKLFKDDV